MFAQLHAHDPYDRSIDHGRSRRTNEKAERAQTQENHRKCQESDGKIEEITAENVRRCISGS